MSNPGLSKLQTLSLTGNPAVDSGIRYGLVGLAGLISGGIIGFLNKEGFHDPDLLVYVPAGVGTLLLGGATALWGVIKSSKNETIARLREAIALQAGITVAQSASIPTPEVVTVAKAQALIAQVAAPLPEAPAPVLAADAVDAAKAVQASIAETAGKADGAPAQNPLV